MLLKILLVCGTVSLVHAESQPAVGKLTGNRATYTGCLATLLGDRAILTTRACLYDSQTKKPHTPLYFILEGSKVQVSKVYPSETSGGGQYDYAVGLLASALAPSSAVFAWTYKALEDAGVKVQTVTNQYPCRSSEDAMSVRMRRVSTEMMHMSCADMASSTLPGGPVFVIDTVTSLPNIVGVYQGRCPGVGTSEVCATRIHGQIYHHVCKVASNNGVKVPGCDDPLLQVCSYCDDRGMRVLNDVDMLKAFNFRVIVRTVDISDLDLLEDMENVPFIVYRRQGQTDWFEYPYLLSEAVEQFSQRSKRTKKGEGSIIEFKPRKTKKTNRKYFPQKKETSKCRRRKARVIKGIRQNTWNGYGGYCTDAAHGYMPENMKNRFLGQGRLRQITVLAATVVCWQGQQARQQIAQFICYNTSRSKGDRHAEQNLRHHLRTHVTGAALAPKKPGSGQDVRAWHRHQQLPLLRALQRRRGGRTAQPAGRIRLVYQQPTHCGHQEHRLRQLLPGPQVGRHGRRLVPAEGRAGSVKTYKTDSGKWNLIRQERKRQTRCETGLLKGLLEEDESMDFVWREKANCVSAVRRELANPMPPLIPVAAWTSETPI